MKTEVIVIANERDVKAAPERAATHGSRRKGDVARLRAQALVLESHELARSPSPPSIAAPLHDALEQHGLAPTDLGPILGSRAPIACPLNGKRGLSLPMLRQPRARPGIPRAPVLAREPAEAA